MKESYWGYWFIILGLFVVSILLLTNDATTTSTQDYYQLKEGIKAIDKEAFYIITDSYEVFGGSNQWKI